jgi:hypothetical protein
LNFIPTTDYATLFKEGLVNLIYSYFLGTISSFNNLHFCLVNYEFANLFEGMLFFNHNDITTLLLPSNITTNFLSSRVFMNLSSPFSGSVEIYSNSKG